MIIVPKMLMVGSTWKNSGKTEFACRLIRKFSPRIDIVGIKVTPVHENDTEFSQRENDSIICSSGKEPYWLTEERGGCPHTDTARMLASGARRVFWLRSEKEYLEKGFIDLLGIIGDRVASVCESNSMRRIVKPGLFLMVKRKDSRAVKPSCRDLIGYADRIVISDGAAFDIEPDDISFLEGKWFLSDVLRPR